jgi:hypothetical protein
MGLLAGALFPLLLLVVLPVLKPSAKRRPE